MVTEPSKTSRRIVRLDPEPLTIFLSVLGAIGSIASIISMLEARRHVARAHQREATKLRLCRRILDVEAELARLGVLLRQALAIVMPFSAEHNFRFGVQVQFQTRLAFQEYNRLHFDIQDSVKGIHRLVEGIIGDLYTGIPAENWDATPLRELISLRDTANRTLFQSHSYREAAPQLQGLMEEAGRVLRLIHDWLTYSQ